ncbi:choice-of-anchor M domain-containing protein [Streptomyces carpaticus]|uniref:choice-of-anchor M domain-containing protein n=1 Tax=Streptomyces carpaticus TaxID=285558 RepID=UPI00220C76D4|nr:choice-of-anchor M domain-containing protein [Streptomyces carpaticus]
MTTRSSPRRRKAVAVLAAVMLAAGTATAAHAADPLILDHGHIDTFHVAVEDGELVLSLAEDVTGSHVRHQPEDVLLRVKEEAWTEQIPSQFPGSPEGYVLPLTQDRNLIWPGWDTNGVAGSGYTDVSIDITDVNGPGDIHLYTLTGFGTPTSLLQDGGFQLPGTIREARPAHTHAQWTFSAAGEYTLQVRATATDPDTGATLTSNPGTYAFSVGDGAAGQPQIPSSLAIHGLADHYHTGDTVSLTAVPDVATDLDHYHWYTRDNAADSWSVVPGLGGAEFTGTADHDGRQIKAALFGDDHAVVAESEPVTVHIDDHGDGEEPIGTVLTVTGAEGHFHPGDTVELTAVQQPATDLDHYHWFTRPDADATWSLAGDAGTTDTYTFTAQADIDGYQVQARLYDDHHDTVATSEPVTLHIQDHGDGEGPVDTVLTVTGAEDHFHPGDTVELTAVQQPATDLDHYHWFTRPDADATWSLAGDAGTTDTYTFTAQADIDGYQVQARLYDDHHDTVATSEPVTLHIQDHSGDHGTGGGTTGTVIGNTSEPRLCLPQEQEVEREVPVTEDFSLVLDHGHIDLFNVTADGGSLTLDLKEDVTGSHERHAPDEVLLHVKPEAYTDAIPDGYPGAPAGYLLPLTQNPDLIWPGWDTNGVAGSGYTDVTIDITDVDGPGDVYLYTTSTFGAAVPVLEGGGFELPGSVREQSPAHTHAQWTFSEPGQYTLTARATATDPAGGGSITSGEETYTFAVDTLPEAAASATGTITETVVVGRTADGQECDLPGGAGGAGGDGANGGLASTGTPYVAGIAVLGTSLLAGGAATTALRRRFFGPAV